MMLGVRTKHPFLDASTNLYMRVGPSVGQTVTHFFYSRILSGNGIEMTIYIAVKICNKTCSLTIKKTFEFFFS